jgi:thiol-disulfide isomerase/thioredoxin
MARPGWKRVLTSRWPRAWVVAGLLLMWPACIARHETDVQIANLDFTLQDLHGKEVRLEEFKGRPLLINFWATWCTPCKYEIPMLVELMQKYKDQNFTVLGISTDDRPDDDLRKFVAEYKINYPVLIGLGNDALQEAYEALVTIPISWFIRADGTVHLKHEGIQTKEWFDRQVQQLLVPTQPAPDGEAPRE